jgi:hypothetical protein
MNHRETTKSLSIRDSGKLGSTDSSIREAITGHESSSSDSSDEDISSDNDVSNDRREETPNQFSLPDNVVKGKEALDGELKYFLAFVIPEMVMKKFSLPQGTIEQMGCVPFLPFLSILSTYFSLYT